jgi:hypothetical protein
MTDVSDCDNANRRAMFRMAMVLPVIIDETKRAKWDTSLIIDKFKRYGAD